MPNLISPLFENFKDQLDAYAKTGVHKQVEGILSISGVDIDVSSDQGTSGNTMPKLKAYQNFQELKEKLELKLELEEKLGRKLEPREVAKLTPKMAQEMVEQRQKLLAEIAARNKIKGPER